MSAKSDLKEAKQVMEDEGGANLASLKEQQVEQAESARDQAKQAPYKQEEKAGRAQGT